VLTCAHCVENKDDIDMISPHGVIFSADVLSYDNDLDLALLKIKKENNVSFVKETTKLKYVKIGSTLPNIRDKLFCIGNPANEDLENPKGGKLDFHPFNVSHGSLRKICKDVIYGDLKKSIGPLGHDCWTYWGHSGSPIFNHDGLVVGIHNSWDDKTGIRHALSTETIKEFKKKYSLKF
jgi:hypothetical protein